MTGAIHVHAAGDGDREAVLALVVRDFGEARVVAHGTVYDVTHLPAYVAVADGRVIGAAIYHEGAGDVEVVVLVAESEHEGVGTVLLDAVVRHAERGGAGRVWLTTTNDNLDAVRFYQRRGMRLVGVRVGAVDVAREIKPGIPVVGRYGIDVHDELVLERRLRD